MVILMVYLLYGTKDYKINEEIKKICKNIDEMDINKYDLTKDDINNILDDAMTIPMFSDKKIIIVDNAVAFTGSSNLGQDEILNYLNSPNENTILIFIVHNEKIDSRKKITKIIQKVGKVLEYSNEENPFSKAASLLKNYKIDTNTLNLFIERVGNNPLIIEKEIEKIKIYKEDNKNITKEDILNLTVKTIDTDIFKLIDYIVKKDRNHALEIYNEMLKINEEPLKIIIILAGQFRIMYQSKQLLKKGYTEKDIASILKIHPYRVKLAIQNARNYDSHILLKYLNDLADIDIGIKTGILNKNLALELFILK